MIIHNHFRTHTYQHNTFTFLFRCHNLLLFRCCIILLLHKYIIYFLVYFL